jgi:Na+-transporting methylmalonyl-CoA/oxaloacetate decarboxylase gamma subunit
MGNEKGMVLVVAILALLVLTILGISSLGTSTFETQLSGNERIGTDAFYGAEAILQVALNQLPETSPIPKAGTKLQIGTDSAGWSGSPADKGTPTELKSYGLFSKAGYDSNWSFKRIQANATGESLGAMKEVEVQICFGPLSTNYNYWWELPA